MSQVHVDNVHKSFGVLEVLKGVSLTVEPGQVVALIGRSGSGKSTVLRCINGLEQISKGTITVAGHTLDDDPGHLRALRTDVGIVFQSYNLFPHLSVGENIMLAPRIVKHVARSEARATAEEVLQLVGLAEKFDAYPDQLSGGQQQRVAIARSLAMRPKVMLFDEVTSALDPELTEEVLGVMERLAEDGMTMLLVTHEMGFARRVANVTVFMHQGRIWEQGPSEALFAEPRTPEMRQFIRSRPQLRRKPMMPIHALQLCPLLPELEHALAERFTVHRWFEAEDPEALLAAHGTAIRAVVTGGHLGLANELAAQLPALEIVAINGVGYDKVDLAQAKARGFRVTNTPDVLTDDVADLAIGLVIALLRRIPQADRHVRDGRWPEAEVPLARKVSAQRFGILGPRPHRQGDRPTARGLRRAHRLHRLGTAGRALQLPPDAHGTRPCGGRADRGSAAAGTRHLIDHAVLDALGPAGMLVNVARGSLVDEAALVAALQEGRLGGAALDVFAAEPRVPETLWSMPNVVLTPHIASATIDTRRAMAELVLANLDAHFSGQPLPTAVV